MERCEYKMENNCEKLQVIFEWASGDIPILTVAKKQNDNDVVEIVNTVIGEKAKKIYEDLTSASHTLEKKTTLKDFLLHKTDVGDVIRIRDDGWYIACVIIDHEDLFIRGLNPKIFNKEIKHVEYEYQEFITQPVTIVDL